MDYLARDLPYAFEIAAQVRSGKATASEWTRRFLARIDELNPKLDAFQAVRRDAALVDAAAVDAHPARRSLPLAGVPVALKDNMAVTGLPARFGSAASADTPVEVDDQITARIKAAGGIVLGLTRMPELAIWGNGASALGVARNPHNPELDPGGSSSGAGAAVISGMAAVAVGTDGGGSIRIPSAYCGTVGLKPTGGSTLLPFDADRNWDGMSVSGPIARCVADASLVQQVLTGNELHLGDPSGVRVAVSTKSPSPLGRPSPHQLAAMTTAQAALKGIGAELANSNPSYPLTLINQWCARWFVGVSEDFDQLELDPQQVEPRTMALVRRGHQLRTRAARPDDGSAFRAEMNRFFERFDVLLTPAVARGPGQAAQLLGKGYWASYLNGARTVPYTQAWNHSGHPAVVITVGYRDALPMAVQLIGRFGSEELLLGVADALHVQP